MTLAWDALSRLSSETTYTTSALAGCQTSAAERQITYAYDLAGDRTGITWPDTGANALTATYAFDDLQRVTAITVGGSVVASYGYDSFGRRSTISRAGGAGAGTSYGYDGADRIDSLVQSLTGAGAVTYTLGYDPSGGLVSRNVNNATYIWHPGAASTSYAANGLNQYASVGGTTPGYTDGRANLTTLSSSGPTFGYDTENNLLSASGPTAVTLTYDPAGRLQTKTAGGATSTFLYAGQMLVGEYDSSGNILARYIPGPGQDEAVLWYSGAGTATPQWLHADTQGSTIAWSNATGGALGSQAYDPYGLPQAWSGPRYSYTGQLMIAEAQLYHYKARAYDPALGRFLQTDPAGYASDLNPYAYVANDPVNASDPSGMVQPLYAGECIICETTVIGGTSQGYLEYDFPATSEHGSGIDVIDPSNYFYDPDDFAASGQASVVETIWGGQVGGLLPGLGGASGFGGGGGNGPQSNGCRASPHMNVDLSLGGTLFGLVVGGSAGAGVGVSIPTSAFSGDFRGTQVYLTGSATGMGGLGLFAGAGPSLGYSTSPSALHGGFSGSAVPVLGGGAGYGYGGEFQGQIGTLKGGLGDMSEGVGFSGSGGPRGAVGGYVGVGVKGTGTIATPSSWTGC